MKMLQLDVQLPLNNVLMLRTCTCLCMCYCVLVPSFPLVRLVDGSTANEGRVDVYYNNTGNCV